MFNKLRSKSNIIVIFLLIFVLSITVFAEPIKVVINAQPLTVPIDPIIEEGRTLVPLRAIFEALNVTVEWDDATKTVTGTRGDKIIKLQIDNKIASINGAPVELDVPGRIVAGSTLVPVRFIAESLGAEVKWNNETRTVLINSEVGQAVAIVEEPVVQVEQPVVAPLPLAIIVNKGTKQVGPIGNPETAQYIGSLKSDKYHYPNYKHTGEILEHNLIYFESKEHAIANGYKPCGHCFK